jgi:small subunit ribosomal protein S8
MYHDTLIRIQNGLMRGKQRVKMPYSQFDYGILELLVNIGYLESIQRKGRGVKRIIDVKLKYDSDKEPAISKVKLVSRPSRQMYTGYSKIKPSHQGYGHFVISTPQGVMTGAEAKKKKIGGQLLFEIW